MESRFQFARSTDDRSEIGVRKLVNLLALVVAALIGVAFAPGHTHVKTRVVATHPGTETLYIRNLTPRYISDREIKHDIPAWEHAVNVDFASYWHTAHYNLIFIGRKPAPVGSISAVFVKKGPIKGALAYHTVGGNAPAITVYAGTGDYYGYDNSVSFTHELFELAADPVTSLMNIGYPADYYWVEKQSGKLLAQYSTAIAWFNEVCDPVEADSYLIGDTRISDFVTDAWFNDGVGRRYDFMGLTQQPFWVRPGGYAIYLDSNGFQEITNFRKGHPSDRGFYIADDDSRRVREHRSS
jgi:hypothetical protein